MAPFPRKVFRQRGAPGYRRCENRARAKGAKGREKALVAENGLCYIAFHGAMLPTFKGADMENETKCVPSINVDFFSELTGDIPAPPQGADNGEDVGGRIARIRTGRGITLSHLSQMTGFEEDVLEGIEKKTIQPQLGTIMRLSKALDAALARLISGTGNKTCEITRRGERKPVKRSTTSKGGRDLYSYYSLAHDVHGRNMEALVVELEAVPGAEKSVHDGEEFIFVLEGTARLEIGGDGFDLEAGDSVYYLSTTPHSITGKNGKARILAVLYEG